MRKLPQLTKSEIQHILDTNNINDDVCIVGIRGYYSNSFGEPGNDRGVYDDAIFVFAQKAFAAFQANVDPSIFRKGIATLKPGIYKAVKHKHQGKYNALQIVNDTVTRDGKPGDDTGRHGINFHFGGENQTWSEGCQTLPKSTYHVFLDLVYSLMNENKLKEITYVLINQK